MLIIAMPFEGFKVFPGFREVRSKTFNEEQWLK
jgi:hypothetical protein